MFSKIVVFGAVLVAACALPYGDKHGAAMSYQSVVRNDKSLHHSAPSYHYSSSVSHIAAPPEHYAAPSKHYSAPIVEYSAPSEHYKDYETFSHPKYDFSYSVDDPHTGDRKSQQESRDGDRVQGYYSLLQPDGVVRKVTYTADDHNGFNAEVSYSAPSGHLQNYEHRYQH